MYFKEIAGQKKTINTLIQVIGENRISHAQLLLGAEGVGKIALALALSRFIQCENKEYFDENSPYGILADSCGKCQSCKQMDAYAHPDVHYIFPNASSKKTSAGENKSSNYLQEWRELLIEYNSYINVDDWYEKLGLENRQGIINVRDCEDIAENLNLKTHKSEYKIFIIWHIEKLFHSAAPKLLKNLEEPPEKTLFLITTDNYDSVLPTIASRTQLIKLEKPSKEDIAEYLTRKYGIDKKIALDTASNADGNVNKAVKLISDKEEISKSSEFIINWLRSCYLGYTIDKSIKGKNFRGLNNYNEEFSKFGREKQKKLLQMTLKIIRNGLISSLEPSLIKTSDKEEIAFLSNFSKVINSENIENIYKALNDAIFHIERNANPKILFMDLSFKLNNMLKNQ